MTVLILILNVAAALSNGAAMVAADNNFAKCLFGLAMVLFFVSAVINVATLSTGRH